MDVFDGTLAITIRLELYDESEREALLENLKTLISERVERWPDSVRNFAIEGEFFRR